MNYPTFQGTSPLQQMPSSPAWGYPVASSMPQQGDFIDQATKILNFAEALRGKEAAKNQPNQQESTYSVGNFTPQTAQTIGAQERRLAELGTSTPASSPFTQTNYAPYSSQEVARLQQQVAALSNVANVLSAEIEQAMQVINSLMPFLAIAPIQTEYICDLEQTVGMLAPFVGVAGIHAGDSLAYEQVLDNICHQFSDPEFLVYWAFLVWGSAIKADGEAALRWIEDEFNNLKGVYEQRYLATTGQHSQIWLQQPRNTSPIMGSPDSQSFYPSPAPNYQLPQAPPMFPIPGAGVGGSPLDQLKQRIAAQKSGNPNLGQDLQRAHVMARQQMMPTMEAV